MNIYDWAKNELKLARENEVMMCKKNLNYIEGDEEYGLMCYDAAEQLLNVFKNQYHSGYSASVVCSIFERLVKGQPLTPVTDEDDQWTIVRFDNAHTEHYQHKRMSNLFKYVYADGVKTYYDTKRVVACDQHNRTSHNKLVDDIIGKYFPIVFPYSGEKIRVRVEDFYDIETCDGCVDVRHIIDAIKNGSEHMNIDRYFMVTDEDGDWREIDVFIYLNIIKNIKEKTTNN